MSYNNQLMNISITNTFQIDTITLYQTVEDIPSKLADFLKTLVER